MLPPLVMLTIKKRRGARQILATLAMMSLTACGPSGPRDLHKGENLIDIGRCAEAIPILNDSVEELRASPSVVQARAWNLLGLACQGAGQLENASRAYAQALKLDRNFWAANYNLGCLRLEQTNYSSAIDFLTTFTTANQKDFDGFLLLGRARVKFAMQHTGLEKSRQLDAARRDYEYSDQLHNSAEACNELGLLELQRKLPHIDPTTAALYYFKEALRRDPHYAPAILNSAIVLQRADELREALDKYREYLALKPAPPDAREVEQIARQLDLNFRIKIVPQTAVPPSSTPPPTNLIGVSHYTPEPVPSTAPKPVPAPTPPPDHVEMPRKTLELTAAPSTPPAVVNTPAPVPAKAPVAVASQSVPAPETSTPPPTQPSPPEVAETETPGPKRKTFAQKLNPINWFSSKSKEAETPVPPREPNSGGSRYAYPVQVTPIPGDRQAAERLVNEGKQAEHQSSLNQAIEDYRSAMKADPTYFEAGLALGLAAIDAKDYSTALDGLGQALALQKDSTDARYAFAWVLGKKGYYQDAANELNNLLAGHPGEVRARLLLGNFYAENLGEVKLAREQYLKALSGIDPQSPQAVVIHAWLGQHPQ